MTSRATVFPPNTNPDLNNSRDCCYYGYSAFYRDYINWSK